MNTSQLFELIPQVLQATEPYFRDLCNRENLLNVRDDFDTLINIRNHVINHCYLLERAMCESYVSSEANERFTAHYVYKHPDFARLLQLKFEVIESAAHGIFGTKKELMENYLEFYNMKKDSCIVHGELDHKTALSKLSSYHVRCSRLACDQEASMLHNPEIRQAWDTFRNSR